MTTDHCDVTWPSSRLSVQLTCTTVSDAGVAVGELGVRVFVPLPRDAVVDSLRWTVLDARAAVVEVSTGLQQRHTRTFRSSIKRHLRQ